MPRTLVLSMVMLCCLVFAPLVRGEESPSPALAEARTRVQGELDRLDGALRRAAERLGDTGLTGKEARSALAGLCGGFSWALDCAAVDATGVMVTMEPAPYRSFEGTSIAGQPQVATMLREHRPVMSRLFMTVEKVHAIDVEYPVTTRNGEFLGSVSLIFPPEQLLAGAIRPVVTGVPLDVLAMEPGGCILFDTDRGEIGLNLFTAPLFQPYTALRQMGERVAAQPAGSGSYRFLQRGEKRAVEKSAVWITVSLYETPWRLVGVRVKHAPARGARPGAGEK